MNEERNKRNKESLQASYIFSLLYILPQTPPNIKHNKQVYHKLPLTPQLNSKNYE